MSPLDYLAHVQQTAIGYCLPACAQMALTQLGVVSTQELAARALGTRVGVGTPFPRVERLSRLGINVQLAHAMSIDALRASLAANKAVIVAIATTPGLPGWGNIRTQHTLLVVSIDGDQIAYHDPALAYGPVSALLAEFLLAWDEMDRRAALLSRE